jgi:hypothetical protein
MVQPPPIQRAIMNRHHQSRRSNSSIAPKAEPASSLPPPLHPLSSATSPKNNRPTPSSHSNSPTNAAFSPAPSDNTSVRGSVGARPPMPHMTGAPRPQMMQNGARSAPTAPNSGASFYPTPAFQNHIEQLGKLLRTHTSQAEPAANELNRARIRCPSRYG